MIRPSPPAGRPALTLLAAMATMGAATTALAQEKAKAPIAAPNAPAAIPGAVGVVPCPPTTISYAPRVSLVPTPSGLIPYAPPLIVTSGAGFPFAYGPAMPPVTAFGPVRPPVPSFVPGPPMPAIPPRPIAGRPGADFDIEARGLRPRRAPRLDLGLSERTQELLTFGDRHFRAGDLPHAERRYRQALKAAPLSALPRLRMAQLAFVRENYREAADRIREAITAEPRWPLRARDIRALYAEPDDFHDALARLEAHLQGQPADRDAWLVLGTQLYLANQTERAADVFLRLTDRRPDATLATLIDAANANR